MFLPIDLKAVKNATHAKYAHRAEIESKLTTVRALLDTYFNAQRSKFISFSCMRNIPQCKGGGSGKGDLTACQTRCKQVSAAVQGFEEECVKAFNTTSGSGSTGGLLSFIGGKPDNATDPTNQIFACRPLGQMKNGEYETYERDCMGDNPDAEYPGLCTAFQVR
jgi:hypothetical protein